MTLARFISKSIKTATPSSLRMHNRLFTTATLTPQQMLTASRAKQQVCSENAEALHKKYIEINGELDYEPGVTIEDLRNTYMKFKNYIDNASEYSCNELIPLFAKKFEEAGSKEVYEELKITNVTGTPNYLILTLETKKPCFINDFMIEKGIISHLVGRLEQDRADSGMIIQRVTLKKDYSKEHYRSVLEALTGQSLEPEPKKNSFTPSSNF